MLLLFCRTFIGFIDWFLLWPMNKFNLTNIRRTAKHSESKRARETHLIQTYTHTEKQYKWYQLKSIDILKYSETIPSWLFWYSMCKKEKESERWYRCGCMYNVHGKVEDVFKVVRKICDDNGDDWKTLYSINR